MKEIELAYQSGWAFSDTKWCQMSVRDKDSGIEENYWTRESPKGPGNDTDALSLMMDYLHRNPNEKIKIHKDSDLREDLVLIASIHNHNISLRSRKEQPLDNAHLLGGAHTP